MAEERDNTGIETVMRIDGEPCGLIIRLEKNILWSEHRGVDPVLGYFDHMEFQPIDNWLGFSPRTTAVELYEQSDEERDGEHPLSIYPIKLLFPEQTVMETLNKEAGLNYNTWRGDFSNLLEQNPCITVLLVNLTDEFKGEIPRDPCGEQLLRFARAIVQGEFLLPENGTEELRLYDRTWAQEANFCIMPSLGYSDYCILLAEQGWRFAPALIEFLHRVGYMGLDSEDLIPILSTDYVIPAYHAVKGTTESETWRCGTQLSMRIHLRPGVNMLTLKRTVGKEIGVYQLSGSSDCVLEAKREEAFNKLLNAVTADGSKDDGKVKEFRNLVVSTETALLRPVPDRELPSQGTMKKIVRSDLITGQIRELRTVLRSYWKLLQDENLHMRQFNSMWARVTSVENICREPHNRSLQEIMGPWLAAFTNALRRCVEQATKDAEAEPRNEETLRHWLKYIDKALKAFISEAGSLLADLSRSDCFFMESERYNHASVSSATALLIAYNRWQNEFVKDVLKEDEDNRCQYAFLVRSGGVDTTTTNNIFNRLIPEVVTVPENGREVLEEANPLITQMSEMSLFDCGGTVLRMTHECMHYCGERQRRKRIKYVIEFSARYFGEYLAHILFSEAGYPQRIIMDLRERFFLNDTNVFESIRKVWVQGIENLRMQIAEWLKERLNSCYEADCKKWHEQNYLSDNLRQWMLEKLTLLLYPYDWKGRKQRYPYSDLVKFLRKEQRRTVQEFYSKCDAEIRRAKIKIACLALDRRQVEGYLDAEEKAEKRTEESKGENWDEVNSGSLMQVILCALNQLLSHPAYGIEMPVPKEFFRGKDLFFALKTVVFDCFSECFADVEACRRLNANLEDYLIGFVFEDWKVPNAISLDAPYLFRIPAVLRVCFRDELDENGAALTKRAENCLRDAVDSLVKNGMSEQRKNAKELIARTNELLEQYQSLVWMAKPLEDYMRECDRYYQTHLHPDMSKYQMAFQHIRLLNNSGNGDITQLFTNLVTIGEVKCVGNRG